MKRSFIIWIIINVFLLTGIGWWLLRIHIPACKATEEKQILSQKHLALKHLEEYLKFKYYRMNGNRESERLVFQMVQQFFDIAIRATAQSVWEGVEKEMFASGKANADVEAIRGRVIDEFDSLVTRLVNGLEFMGISLKRVAYEDRERVPAGQKITITFIRDFVEYCTVFEINNSPIRLPEPSFVKPGYGRGLVMNLSTGRCVLSIGNPFSPQEVEILRTKAEAIGNLDTAFFRLKSYNGKWIGLRKYSGFFGPFRVVCEIPVDIPAYSIYRNELLWIFCILVVFNGFIPVVMFLIFRSRLHPERFPVGTMKEDTHLTYPEAEGADGNHENGHHGRRVNREFHKGKKNLSSTTENASSELLKDLMRKIKD